MLAAGAGGPVDLHLDILVPDLDLVVIFDLGHHLHRSKGGLPAGVGVKGRDPHQTVHAVLALQKAIGILALDGDGRGLDARLVTVFIVEDLVGELMPLRPAGVHPVEHLGPVLGLGAAGTGVEGQNGVVAVVLPGEERSHPGLLHLLLQGVEPVLELLEQFGVIGLLAHLAKGGEILPLVDELLLPGHLVLQLLEALLHLLGALQVVPESILGGLILQPGGLGAGAVDVQRRGELLQLRAQLPELLLVLVVFDQCHCVTPFPFFYISYSIIPEK